jgi:tRNA G18 (ribose-2'-O)-methylase SpoU
VHFDTKILIEFVSDSIHLHRIKAGLCPKDHDLLVQVMSADRKLPEKQLPVFHYHIALDGLRSLFNTGSIFRTCDAAGFQSIILGNTPGPEHPVVRKTSMGASNWVSFTKTDDLAAGLYAMKKKGFKITGIETVKDSESYANYSWQEKGVVVFGNEEYGISSHVMKICDDFVHIPMFGVKNSLNVANSVSIIVFHIAGCCKTAQIVRA